MKGVLGLMSIYSVCLSITFNLSEISALSPPEISYVVGDYDKFWNVRTLIYYTLLGYLGKR